MRQRKSLLPAAFCLLLSLAHSCPAQMPSQTVAAKMRRLLPLPEGTLNPKTELTMGLGFSPDRGYFFRRQSSDYTGQIAAVRRQMTGGVADALRYRQLGGLYRSAGLPAKSKAAFRQSEALDNAVLAQRPDDGPALAGYGLALQGSGQLSAAEAYLRKATQIAPGSADVWMALGSVLEGEASPKTEATMHWGQEIEAAYDRAVLIAPQNPAAWVTRGDFRTWGHGKIFSRDGLSDYVQAASLLPRDPDAQAQVPTIDCFAFEAAHHMFTSPEAAKMEPAASDHRAEWYLHRIAAIAQDAHGAQEAEAMTAMAWVQFEFFYDPAGAQKSLHLALEQNPFQQDAIDYRMHVAGVTGNYVLLAVACRRELRRHPAVYLRVLLAEADYDLAQQKPKYWQEGLTQMELAHAAQPHDYACALGLATFLLKSGRTARADLLLAEIAPQAQSRSKEQQAEYDVTRGIAAALSGRQEEAREFLGRTLKNDPQNKPAKSAMALLPTLPQPQ